MRQWLYVLELLIKQWLWQCVALLLERIHEGFLGSKEGVRALTVVKKVTLKYKDQRRKLCAMGKSKGDKNYLNMFRAYKNDAHGKFKPPKILKCGCDEVASVWVSYSTANNMRIILKMSRQ